MAEYSVLIIGAGTKGTSGPVSHAKAFAYGGFNIVGFVDASPDKAEAAARTWGGQAFDNIDTAFAALGSVDVVVVAVSDSQQETILRQLVGKQTRLIFAEKPFTRSAKAAKELLEAFKANDQTVMVNYTRRFSMHFDALERDIKSGKFGGFLNGSGFYGKGLCHNGSHMLDLLLMLFDDVQAIRAIGRIYDGDVQDPSVSALLGIGDQTFYLGVLPRTSINAFEATLYFEKGVTRITNCGRTVEIFKSIPRPDFPAERIYEPKGTNISSLRRSPMATAVHNIADHLSHGAALLSPAENAVKVLELCEALS